MASFSFFGLTSLVFLEAVLVFRISTRLKTHNSKGEDFCQDFLHDIQAPASCISLNIWSCTCLHGIPVWICTNSPRHNANHRIAWKTVRTSHVFLLKR